ncbi:glycosyltransferase [Kocuria sp. JC486]|uniref:glycosyltransferase n=1 Tax=Kocuria sp. JC486 TaxID=1970736 RepID=UPI001420DA56
MTTPTVPRPIGHDVSGARIALLCLHTSPLVQPGQGDAGGMNVYVRHLAESLVQLCHPVDLVTLWRASEHPNEQEPDRTITVTTLDSGVRLVTVHLPGTTAVGKNELPRELPAITEALRRAYSDSDLALVVPDVVHGHYWLSAAVATDLAAEWQIPAVTTFHTTARAKNARAGTDEHPEPEIREDGEQRIVDRSQAVVVNTASEARDLTSLYSADPDRVRVIPPGVDVEVFRPGGPAARDGAFTIGFAGRLQPLKGPQILVEALALVRAAAPGLDARLWLAGVGSSEFTAELDERVARLGLGHVVETVGSLPVEELARRFRSSDVIAVPSSSETFGLVALEAQACGTPVVATDVDGLRAAVDDGETGWLLPDRSPKTWAEALVAIAKDPAELERRGALAAERARGFSWGANAEAHAALHQALRSATAPGEANRG